VESITTGGIKKNLREQVVAIQKGRRKDTGESPSKTKAGASQPN
jgi:hypothetical protein